MHNEEIVCNIQHGKNVQENMLLLYNKNMTLIKNTCLKYAGSEPLEDLMQVAFISLYDSTSRYNAEKGYKYITYCLLWVRQAILRYLSNCGKTIRLPEDQIQLVYKYKRFVNDFQLVNGRTPKDTEVIQALCIDGDFLDTLKIYSQHCRSLDEEIETDTESYSLIDTVASDEDLENDCIEREYDAFQKKKLWEIVKNSLVVDQADVLRERYLNNRTYREIAVIKGITSSKARQLEHDALRRLRINKRNLTELDIDHLFYKGGLRRFKEKAFTSCVESVAFNRIENEKEYIQTILRREENYPCHSNAI